MTVRASDSSTASAARFLRTYERRAAFHRSARARAVAAGMRKHRREANPVLNEALDESIVNHLGRFPRKLLELHRDVTNDYGTVSVNRLEWRLGQLIKNGAITRSTEGYARARAQNQRAA